MAIIYNSAVVERLCGRMHNIMFFFFLVYDSSAYSEVSSCGNGMGCGSTSEGDSTNDESPPQKKARCETVTSSKCDAQGESSKENGIPRGRGDGIPLHRRGRARAGKRSSQRKR